MPEVVIICVNKDTPIHFPETPGAIAVTRPLPSWRGWRFRAIGEDHRSIVFDVREGANGGPWRLLRTRDYIASSSAEWFRDSILG